jgi:protein arginine N-methyltransferase 1
MRHGALSINTMDTVQQHCLLVSDKLGQSRYRKAIFKTVKAGDLVLDLGTGTGIHALFSCQAGAKKVYAVEQGEIIEQAKEISRANGLEDRIVFIQGLSSQVELPEKVDVIVTHLGLRGILSSLIDVRERFLKKGGMVIPAAMELFCVPLEWPAVYDDLVDFWSLDHYGINFSPMRQVAVNKVHGKDFTSDNFLAEPVSLGRLDLRKATDTRIGGEATFHALRKGILHGVGVWYTLWLDEDTSLSTGPPLVLPSSLWGQSFFPIERPVEIQREDHIDVKMKASAFKTAGVVWKWEGQVEGSGSKTTFTHSTFNGLPLSRESLHKQAPDYTPPLTPLGQAGRLILNLCDSKTSLSEIEQEVCRQFSILFQTQQDAATFVARVLRKYAA